MKKTFLVLLSSLEFSRVLLNRDLKGLSLCPRLASLSAGEPTVTLTERCRGLVKINDVGVCSDGSTFEHAHIACMEQDCGNAVLVDNVSAGLYPDGLLIRCESYHDQLGKCSRVMGSCEKGLMYIHCAGKSVCVFVSFKTETAKHLGKCFKIIFSTFLLLFTCRKHKVENQRPLQRPDFGQ